jgi:tetratricopeptide (TPR) repeat protein
MTANTSFGSPAFDVVARGTIALHRLIAQGKGDDAEAEALRDSLDEPIAALSQIERERARFLSADLFSLSETNGDQPAKLMNPQVQKNFNAIYEAKTRKEWERALNLLRRWQEYLPPSLLSYLRGSIWYGAGKFEIAAEFFRHAADLEPNGNYPALYVHALARVDPLAAKHVAEGVLKAADRYSPAVIVQAAQVVAASTHSLPATATREVEANLIPVVEAAIRKMEADGAEDAESYAMAAIFLGSAHGHAGNTRAAYDYYSRGLRADPRNDALLTLRGILMYGVSPGAAADLELAVKDRSPAVWPYFFLAHHYLVKGRYEDCRKMCERASEMPATDAMRSELMDWLAIAEAQLGFPADRVRRRFEEAIRLDPSNDRAQKNLTTFEGLTGRRPEHSDVWVKPSESALRAYGLAEYTLAP